VGQDTLCCTLITGYATRKGLTAMCAAEQAKLDPSKEFEITLGVIEGEELPNGESQPKCHL
jgi:hypothetical protein